MKKNKILAITLTAAMAAGLMACGGSSSSSTSTSESAAASTEAAADTAAASATEAAADTAAEETAAEDKDYSDYTIRIYSNSNSTERTTWLINEAKDAGFTISIDDNSVISGDTAAVQAANENKDGDLIFGLNETRWSQISNGAYENLSLVDWTPTWADKVGTYKFDGKAYGLVVQGSLLLYRTDEYGTNGETLSFDHWADMMDAGYSWYRQNKVGGTTNTNINNSLLFAYVDPDSEAGGISVDGWKMLWRYCADGVYSSDDTYKYGFDPLNAGDVAISSYYTSSLYGNIDAAAETSEHPLLGTTTPENWALADVKDGVFYIAEYIGILDKADRTDEQTEAVKAFAEWFGSADVQAAWGSEFDSFPCNEDAAASLYPDGIPDIYTQTNMAQAEVDGETYAVYAADHNPEWTNIETNLGYFWSDPASAASEPDWDNLDWATLTQAAAE